MCVVFNQRSLDQEHLFLIDQYPGCKVLVDIYLRNLLCLIATYAVRAITVGIRNTVISGGSLGGTVKGNNNVVIGNSCY